MSERPHSEVYRDGFRDGMASTKRAIEQVEATMQIIGLDRESDVRASLRGLADALDWGMSGPNTDQVIAHWKALQAENT